MKNGICNIGILHGKASSSCPEAYQFQISAVAKLSGAKLCTNVPMCCVLCNEIQWKYHMDQHLRDRHPGWELTTTELSAKILISHNEECRLGVPEAAQTSQPEMSDGSSGPSTGEKRLPTSPAGTPRVNRILRTSARHAEPANCPSFELVGDERDLDAFIA
ncbi:hypothetical protein B0H10DRAFT_2040373 [Mycena sp. CBHHK59/15]|nr:hypothetical protein B0H10DRAFT_2040373 [Mycena sp. CBHHK59/15]